MENREKLDTPSTQDIERRKL